MKKKKSRQVHRDRKNYIVELLGSKCSLCGIKDHPCIYDTHHKNQSSKTYNCSTILDKLKLAQELSKCELLCIRCHRLVQHERQSNGKNRVWKECQKCNQNFWHEIKKQRRGLDTVISRQNKNIENQKKMLQFWKLGRKICKKHESKKWRAVEWNLYCQNNFNMGDRNAYDYEKLFKKFSTNNLPSSLNGVRTKKYTTNSIDENNTHYVHNMCVKCENNKRRERKNKTKNQAISYLGGKCYACNSTIDSVGFDFHHIDPSLKRFGISTRKLFNDELIRELKKCVLLCCYCHRKVHSGVLSIIDPLTF